MTQDEYKRLLLGVVDDVNFIAYYLDYLKIALEQLQKPDEKTLDRVEILVSGFLDLTECHLDELSFSCKDIVKLCNNDLTEN